MALVAQKTIHSLRLASLAGRQELKKKGSRLFADLVLRETEWEIKLATQQQKRWERPTSVSKAGLPQT